MSETSGAAVRGRALSRELGRMLALIGREQDRLSEKGRELPPGADWLLDNWYLIEREGKLAASELRRAGRLRASGGSALIVSACRAPGGRGRRCRHGPERGAFPRGFSARAAPHDA